MSATTGSNPVILMLATLLDEAPEINVVVGSRAFMLDDADCPVNAVATVVRARIAEVVREHGKVRTAKTQAAQAATAEAVGAGPVAQPPLTGLR